MAQCKTISAWLVVTGAAIPAALLWRMEQQARAWHDARRRRAAGQSQQQQQRQLGACTTALDESASLRLAGSCYLVSATVLFVFCAMFGD